MRGFVAWANVCVLAVALTACGDDDGGTIDAAVVEIDATVVTPDGGVFPDAAPCNALAQAATEVAQTQVAEAPPTPIGGTIPDGVSHRVSDIIYTGVGGMTGVTGVATTFTASCTALTCDIVEQVGTQVNRFVFVLAPNGTALTLTESCPGNGVANTTYSVETMGGKTTVTIFEGNGANTLARAYELQ